MTETSITFNGELDAWSTRAELLDERAACGVCGSRFRAESLKRCQCGHDDCEIEACCFCLYSCPPRWSGARETLWTIHCLERYRDEASEARKSASRDEVWAKAKLNAIAGSAATK